MITRGLGNGVSCAWKKETKGTGEGGCVSLINGLWKETLPTETCVHVTWWLIPAFLHQPPSSLLLSLLPWMWTLISNPIHPMCMPNMLSLWKLKQKIILEYLSRRRTGVCGFLYTSLPSRRSGIKLNLCLLLPMHLIILHWTLIRSAQWHNFPMLDIA